MSFYNQRSSPQTLRRIFSAGVLGLLLIVSPGLALAAETLAGRAMAVAGNVRAIDSQGKERLLQKGGEVRSGDRIITDEDALVQLLMADGGYLSVRAGTDMAITSFVHDEKNWKNSNFLVSLAKGGFRSITGLIGKRNRDGYQISAATATIGIRGTDHEPMLILAPAAGQPMLNPPGIYDKVNQGETFIKNERGILALTVGQVGFAPTRPDVAPLVLPKIPSFYNPTPKTDGRNAKTAQDGKADERQADAGQRGESRQDGGKQEAGKQEGGRQDGGRQEGGKQDGGQQANPGRNDTAGSKPPQSADGTAPSGPRTAAGERQMQQPGQTPTQQTNQQTPTGMMPGVRPPAGSAVGPSTLPSGPIQSAPPRLQQAAPMLQPAAPMLQPRPTATAPPPPPPIIQQTPLAPLAAPIVPR